MTPQQILALLLEIADLRTERDALRVELARRDQAAATTKPAAKNSGTRTRTQ